MANVEDELEAQLAFGSEERIELAAEIDRLQSQLASARSREVETGRRPFDPWLVGGILLGPSPSPCSRSVAGGCCPR